MGVEAEALVGTVREWPKSWVLPDWLRIYKKFVENQKKSVAKADISTVRNILMLLQQQQCSLGNKH